MKEQTQTENTGILSPELVADAEKAIAEAAPNEPAEDVARMTEEAAEVVSVEPESATESKAPIYAPPMPSTRTDCQATMDDAHRHISEIEAYLATVRTHLDKLIQHHNRLPKE